MKDSKLIFICFCVFVFGIIVLSLVSIILEDESSGVVQDVFSSSRFVNLTFVNNFGEKNCISGFLDSSIVLRKGDYIQVNGVLPNGAKNEVCIIPNEIIKIK